MAAAATAAGIGSSVAGICCCDGSRGQTSSSNRHGWSSAFHGAALPGRRSMMAFERRTRRRAPSGGRSLVVLGAKLPPGVEAPREEPKLSLSLWGFTEKAEAWNSRAAMIGIFGLVALEFFLHRGILQLAGVEVGKGLDLPL